MKLLIRTCLLALILLGFTQTAHAEPRLLKIEATAYCNPHNNPTASGAKTVEGETLSGKRAWMGERVLVFYEEDGEPGNLYGLMEFQDTGGDERIKNGEVIDIFMEEYDDCIEWGRKDVFLLFLDEVEFV